MIRIDSVNTKGINGAVNSNRSQEWTETVLSGTTSAHNAPRLELQRSVTITIFQEPNLNNDAQCKARSSRLSKATSLSRWSCNSCNGVKKCCSAVFTKGSREQSENYITERAAVTKANVWNCSAASTSVTIFHELNLNSKIGH